MVRVTQCSQVPETGTFAVLEVRDIVLEVELNGPNLDSGYFRKQNSLHFFSDSASFLVAMICLL